jgi:hypothetical protein
MDINHILIQSRREIAGLIRSEFGDATEDALRDASDILGQTKARLEKWGSLLEEGAIDEEEFGWLVAAQREVVAITGLKHAGITPDRVERFAVSVLGIVAKVALAAVLSSDAA